jgi:hypothetical protein
VLEVLDAEVVAMHGIISILVAGSFCWFVASSLWVYPHSLSYFNESIGGPLNGPAHLLGSNVDWGQDLRYLEWCSANPRFERRRVSLQLAYFGYFSPTYLGFKDTLSWQREPTTENSISKPTWCAASVNLLHGLSYAAQDGLYKPVRLSEQIRDSFKNKWPSAYAGYSMVIFAQPVSD